MHSYSISFIYFVGLLLTFHVVISHCSHPTPFSRTRALLFWCCAAVNIAPGKSFTVNCPSEGDDAYAEGLEQGIDRTQAACDAALLLAAAETSTLQAQLSTAAVTVEENDAAIKAKDAAFKVQSATLTEQTVKLSDVTAALKTSQAEAERSSTAIPTWHALSATKGGTTNGELYIVSPAGGGDLYINGVGFDTLEKTLGGWNPKTVSCIFTPSSEDEKITSSPTAIVDGVVDGSRMLKCTLPPIAVGGTANVTLEWFGGTPVSLFSRGVATNTFYSASWYTGLTLVDGHPTISGIGFSPDGDFSCLFFIPGTKDETDRTTATFVSATELRCNVDLDEDGPILKEYNENSKTKVVVTPQIGTDGKYTDLASDKPASIPFDSGFPTGSPLTYRYIDTACGDGIKAANEIGVDCGLKACGKACEWDGVQGAVANGDACDSKTDCESNFCNTDGECAFGYFSCYNVLQNDKDAESGFYNIGIDQNWRGFEKAINSDGTQHEVYCDFYDGRAFTLFDMMCSGVNAAGTSPYQIRSKQNRHPGAKAKIGRMYKSNQNQCARLEVDFINSIFKHSEGYVMTRYNNNNEEYHVTDVFGTPEDDKHILAKEHECSQKNQFNLAYAYRPGSSGANAGMCFNDGGTEQGVNGRPNNCICNDHFGGFSFNRCNGAHGNLRRYNGKRSRSKFCSSMSSKCNSYPHGVLGDSSGCDVPGQRHIGGHFWISLSGRNGAPCGGYNTYGCYGSRWIG